MENLNNLSQYFAQLTNIKELLGYAYEAWENGVQTPELAAQIAGLTERKIAFEALILQEGGKLGGKEVA